MADQDTTPTPLEEDFAQLLTRLKDDYAVNDSEIARRIDVSVSTVHTWLHRKRTPRPAAIRAIAAAFPRYSEGALFEAAGRRAPGPLSPAAEERLLELFRGLTPEQQAIKEIELRALNEANRK